MIKIVTDSANILPDSMLKEYDITLLKDSVAEHAKDEWKEFPNDKEKVAEIVKKLEDKIEFKTAAVSPGRFKEAFDQLTKNGDSVIYVSLTARAGKDHDIAVSVKNELPGRDITVIDSDGGLGLESLVTLSLARAIKDGKSKDEAISSALETRKNSKCLVAIPDISYLYRTGRMPQAKNMTQAVLKLVALVGFLHAQNEVFSFVSRERNMISANSRIVSYIEEDLKKNGKQKVRCILGDLLNEEAAANLKEQIQKAGWCEELIGAEEFPEEAVIVGPRSWILGYELI